MKRRIIKQGHNTLTVTLPSKWVQLFNLKPGDEIEINERENGLFLSTEKHDDELKTEIDITGFDIATIWKYIMSVYREGYDEVKITFDPTKKYGHPRKFFTSESTDIRYGKNADHTPYEVLRVMASRFIGFEIIEHHKNYCIMKNMAVLTSKEFDPSLRRVFLLLQQMGEETLESLKKNDPKIVSHMRDIDINVDKFVDYCVRVLNKTGFKDVKKAHLLFSVLYLLELLGDEFKNLSGHLLRDMKKSPSKEIIELAERSLKQVNDFYSLYYNFTRENLIAISDDNLVIRLHKENRAKKGGQLSVEEYQIMSHLARVGRYVKALIELRIEMEF
jgi:phosphate uptake regulator